MRTLLSLFSVVSLLVGPLIGPVASAQTIDDVILFNYSKAVVNSGPFIAPGSIVEYELEMENGNGFPDTTGVADGFPYNRFSNVEYVSGLAPTTIDTSSFDNAQLWIWSADDIFAATDAAPDNIVNVRIRATLNDWPEGEPLEWCNTIYEYADGQLGQPIQNSEDACITVDIIGSSDADGGNNDDDGTDTTDGGTTDSDTDSGTNDTDAGGPDTDSGSNDADSGGPDTDADGGTADSDGGTVDSDTDTGNPDADGGNPDSDGGNPDSDGGNPGTDLDTDGGNADDDGSTGTPALTLQKQVSPAIVDMGDTFTYTFTVTNTGDVPLTGVTVTDSLPAGITFLSSNPAPSTTSPLTWSINSIPTGGQTVITMTATTNQSTIPGPDANCITQITNFANVTTSQNVNGNTSEKVTVNHGDDCNETDTDGGGPDTDSDGGNPDSDGGNPGTDTDADGGTADSDGGTVDSDTDTGNPDADGGNPDSDGGNPGTDTDADGGTADSDGGTVDGDADTGNPDSDGGNQDDDGETGDPAILITKSGPTGIVNSTDQFEFLLAIDNTGDVPLTNVVVEDILPAGLVFVGSDYTTVGPNTPAWNLGTMAPGQGITVSVVVEVDENSLPTPNGACRSTTFNLANVEADQNVTDSATATVTIQQDDCESTDADADGGNQDDDGGDTDGPNPPNPLLPRCFRIDAPLANAGNVSVFQKDGQNYTNFYTSVEDFVTSPEAASAFPTYDGSAGALYFGPTTQTVEAIYGTTTNGAPWGGNFSVIPCSDIPEPEGPESCFVVDAPNEDSANISVFQVDGVTLTTSYGSISAFINAVGSEGVPALHDQTQGQLWMGPTGRNPEAVYGTTSNGTPWGGNFRAEPCSEMPGDDGDSDGGNTDQDTDADGGTEDADKDTDGGDLDTDGGTQDGDTDQGDTDSDGDTDEGDDGDTDDGDGPPACGLAVVATHSITHVNGQPVTSDEPVINIGDTITYGYRVNYSSPMRDSFFFNDFSSNLGNIRVGESSANVVFYDAYEALPPEVAFGYPLGNPASKWRVFHVPGPHEPGTFVTFEVIADVLGSPAGSGNEPGIWNDYWSFHWAQEDSPDGAVQCAGRNYKWIDRKVVTCPSGSDCGGEVIMESSLESFDGQTAVVRTNLRNAGRSRLQNLYVYSQYENALENPTDPINNIRQYEDYLWYDHIETLSPNSTQSFSVAYDVQPEDTEDGEICIQNKGLRWNMSESLILWDDADGLIPDFQDPEPICFQVTDFVTSDFSVRSDASPNPDTTTLQPEDIVTYTVTVTNNTGEVMQDVQIIDQLPEHFTYLGNNGDPNLTFRERHADVGFEALDAEKQVYAGAKVVQELVYQFDQLAVGESQFQYQVRVKDTFTPAVAYVCNPVDSATGIGGSTTVQTWQASMSNGPCFEPFVSTQGVGYETYTVPERVAVGQTVEAKLVLENYGNVPLTNVRITPEALPPSLRPADGTELNIFTLPEPLPVGGVTEITYTLTPTESARNVESAENGEILLPFVLQMTADEIEGYQRMLGRVTFDDSVSAFTATTTSVPVKETNVRVGDTITYTYSVENTTESTLDTVILGDNLPDGVEYQPAGDARVSYTESGETRTVTMMLTAIAPGATQTIDYQVVVNRIPPSFQLCNDLEFGAGFLSGDIAVTGTLDDGVCHTVGDLALAMTVGASSSTAGSNVFVGEDVRVSIDLENMGTTALQDAEASVVLPLGVSYVGNEPGVTPRGQVLTLDFGVVPPPADVSRASTKTITLPLRMVRAGTHCISAQNVEAQAEGINATYVGEAVCWNAEDPGDDRLVDTGYYKVEKRASRAQIPASVAKGDTITYTISIQNTSAVALTNVLACDVLDTFLVYQPGSHVGVSYPSNNPQCSTLSQNRVVSLDFGTIQPGETKSRAFEATVAPFAANGIIIQNDARIDANIGASPLPSFYSNETRHLVGIVTSVENPAPPALGEEEDGTELDPETGQSIGQYTGDTTLESLSAPLCEALTCPDCFAGDLTFAVEKQVQNPATNGWGSHAVVAENQGVNARVVNTLAVPTAENVTLTAARLIVVEAMVSRDGGGFVRRRLTTQSEEWGSLAGAGNTFVLDLSDARDSATGNTYLELLQDQERVDVTFPYTMDAALLRTKDIAENLETLAVAGVELVFTEYDEDGNATDTTTHVALSPEVDTVRACQQLEDQVELALAEGNSSFLGDANLTTTTIARGIVIGDQGAVLGQVVGDSGENVFGVSIPDTLLAPETRQALEVIYATQSGGDGVVASFRNMERYRQALRDQIGFLATRATATDALSDLIPGATFTQVPGRAMFLHEGTSLTLGGELDLSTSATIIADEIIINENLTLPGAPLALIADRFIVSPAVTQLDGLFLSLDASGEMSYTPGTTATQKLTTTGLMLTNIRPLVEQNIFRGENPVVNGIEESVRVVFDARVLDDVPPGLETLLGGTYRSR